MALIKCEECGNKVNETDSVCQTCGNPLSPLANEVLKNIDKIKIGASLVRKIFIMDGIMCIILTFFLTITTDVSTTLSTCLGASGVFLIVLSPFIEAYINSKAYMLEINYQILRNTGGDKKWH